MTSHWIRRGFLAAGGINLGGVLLFSKGFTNQVLSTIDPVVMSNFGLVMIMVWGLAYIAVAREHERVPWLVAVFTIEKAVYGLRWLLWLNQTETSLLQIFEMDAFAGVFYTIYGANDLAFMVFFAWVFLRSRRRRGDQAPIRA